MIKRIYLFLFVVVFSLIVIFSYKFTYHREFLTFSDGAKFADIARNIVNGLGYGGSFKFFGSPDLTNLRAFPYPVSFIPPLMPLSIAAAFKLIGISDMAVIATSGFYYILLVVTVFFLGRKLFGDLTGFLAAVAVATNLNFLDYATSGASEPLFAFEIVLAAYFFILRKKWTDVAGFVTLVLMYFTRPQAFIFIAGYILLWLLLRYEPKKALKYFLGVVLLGFLVDRLILIPLSGKFFLYSITGRGEFVIPQTFSGFSPGEALRGAVVPQVVFQDLLKKAFFNLYNFYKLLPQIASPYMWALFAVAFFKWGKDKVENSLKVSVLFMVIATFLVAALTIPLLRYLHPVIPLVYLFATATLVWIVKLVVSDSWLVTSEKKIKSHQSPVTSHQSQRLVVLISTFLVLFFVVGQTLGVIFLDSRFWAKRRNLDKPPVYVQLSWILRENTKPDDVIITNLDTWGSWYGERRTIWYPLRPEQLIPPEGKEISFDAIYLTSYLIDDENYYMGSEWRQAFFNPDRPQDSFISQNFVLKSVYNVRPEDNYERMEAKAVLWVKKVK